MRQINKQELNVRSLRSRLRAQMISRIGNWRWNMDADTAHLFLAAAYAEVVRSVGGTCDKNDEPCKGNILKLAEFMTSPPSKKCGVIFRGKCGNGKTTLIYALRAAWNELYQMGALGDDEPHTLRVVSALDVQKMEDVSELARTPLLAIDDLGSEKQGFRRYGNIVTNVTDLLYERYNQRLFTVISTNLTNAQIKETYGARIEDRLRGVLVGITFRNTSYRQ